jgi:predicted site-specific integrase-resolvase
MSSLDGRITVTIREACEATGLCRMSIWRLRRDGQLEAVTVRKRKLILVASLMRLLEAGEAA